MLIQYEAQALQQSMQKELRAEPVSLSKCAIGLAIVAMLSLLAPLVGLDSSASPIRMVASADLLEHLNGMAP